MNKSIYIIILSTIILSIFLSGCIENDDNSNDKQKFSYNSVPIALIHTSKDTYYFGETIELDASKSYDLDGEIISYTWDFGNGDTLQGKTVNYIYEFENDFDVIFPIIYTTILYIKDDDNSIKATDHQIMLFPKEYKFYLNSDKLTTEKPSVGSEILTKTSLQHQISYSFEKSLSIQKCKWNTTIYIDKPILALATKITISFYDNNGSQIIIKEKKLGLNTLWKEKTVQMNGIIDKTEEIKSVTITVTSFSLRNKINILTGGEKASFIMFDFTV